MLKRPIIMTLRRQKRLFTALHKVIFLGQLEKVVDDAKRQKAKEGDEEVDRQVSVADNAQKR